jgi:hypothetical protein
VELPPKKAGEFSQLGNARQRQPMHTLLIQNKHIAAILVDGVGGTEAGHCEGPRSASCNSDAGTREM